MRIVGMEVGHCNGSGWSAGADIIHHPTWDEVEASISRLDPFRYPFLRLSGGHRPRGEGMEILGGNGKFRIRLFQPLARWQLFDPDKSNNEVRLWTGDRMEITYDFHVLRDEAEVFVVAWHYFRFGEGHPEYDWLED